MPQRSLGKTGLMVSPIGYGAFKLGRNRGHHFASDYELPTEPEATRLLNEVLDAGITLIDTAPAYGLSEERIGRAIGHRRDEYVLATKVGEEFFEGRSQYDFSASAVNATIERSLSRLHTDHLDLVCVHSNGDDLRIPKETHVVATLENLKSRGLIRAIGFSAKTVDGARTALDWADVLMATFHRNDVSQADVIKAASANGVAVIVKKGLASGRLPAGDAIPLVLNQPGVTSLLIDTLSSVHLRENLAIADQCLSQGEGSFQSG